MFLLINIKILIDSGFTKSFIDPNIAFKYYPNCIYDEPFIVSLVFQKSAHKHSAVIPALKIFNLPTKFKIIHFLDFTIHLTD